MLPTQSPCLQGAERPGLPLQSVGAEDVTARDTSVSESDLPAVLHWETLAPALHVSAHAQGRPNMLRSRQQPCPGNVFDTLLTG